MRDTRRLMQTLTVRMRRMPGPDLDPTSKRLERRVFLEADLWERLTNCSEFHQRVFDHLGVKETVSRNDIIASFLDWAEQAYWDDKGGKPTSKTDFEAKAKRHAEKKRQQMK